MDINKSTSRKIFLAANLAFLIIVAVVCVLPLINVLAVSLSDKSAASGGFVKLWPVNFTTAAYGFVLNRPAFWRAMLVTVERVLLGGTINMALVVLCAYPLSKSKGKFRARGIFTWILFFSALFSGGLIPGYILVYDLGLMDTLWALVLPGATPIFNVILMLNFFRQIPSELEEVAAIDGANPWRTLFSIYRMRRKAPRFSAGDIRRGFQNYALWRYIVCIINMHVI
jgi:putative aldouronate transport system permease protein